MAQGFYGSRHGGIRNGSHWRRDLKVVADISSDLSEQRNGIVMDGCNIRDHS